MPTADRPESSEELARWRPGGLGLVTDRTYRYPPHIELIDREVVEAIERGRKAEAAGTWVRPEILLVEVPPRHGKSELISKNTPAWFLGRYPDLRIMLASYQERFAATWGRKARNVLEEYGKELYGIEVDAASRAAGEWNIKGHRGGMTTAGVGGEFTGRGADLLLIDDPTKNAEEALSDVIRDKQQDWFRSTIRTRIEPGGVVVILMTRWHVGDLGGFVLSQAADGSSPVREIRLPAIAEDEDPLGREPGDALWPERYSREALDSLRQDIGPYWFGAMFMGSPVPDEGGIFARRDFRYFRIEGEQAILDLPGDERQTWAVSECRKITYLDLAVSEKSTADYTVLTEAWVTPERQLLIRNVHRDRIPGPDQPDFVKAHYVGVIKPETIGYQTALVQALQREGLPVEPVYPDKDKVTRASAAGALYRAGQVYHLAGAEWLGDFELELLAFPAGEHDDQVDTVAYAARDLPNLDVATQRTQRRRGQTMTGGLLTQQL